MIKSNFVVRAHTIIFIYFCKERAKIDHVINILIYSLFLKKSEFLIFLSFIKT